MTAASIAGAVSSAAFYSERELRSGAPLSGRELFSTTLLKRSSSLELASSKRDWQEKASRPTSHHGVSAAAPAPAAAIGERVATRESRFRFSDWLQPQTSEGVGQRGHGPYLPLPTKDDYEIETDKLVVDLAADADERDRLAEWRSMIKLMLEDPTSSQSAAFVQYGMFIVIMAAVSCAMCETVPEIEHYAFFMVVEPVFTALFTIEISLRWWTADSSWSFVSSTFNLIDCLSTFPGYIDIALLVMQGTSRSKAEHTRLDSMHSFRAFRLAELVRIVRLLRVLRVANTLRQSEMIVVVLKSIYGSLQGIWVLLAFAMVGTIISSTAMYCIEMDQGNGFDSIPASMWWGASTITAVGYGDLLPSTTAGKCVAVSTMLLGTVIMAVCIAVVTNSFTIEYQRELYLARMRRFRREAEESGLSPSSPYSSKAPGIHRSLSKSSLMQRRRNSGKQESSALGSYEQESMPGPGAFGGAGFTRADRRGSSSSACPVPSYSDYPDGAPEEEEVEKFMNQLEQMTEALLLSFQASLDEQEPDGSDARWRKKKQRSGGRTTLQILRKSSSLWFEHARLFSEELASDKVQQVTEERSGAEEAE